MLRAARHVLDPLDDQECRRLLESAPYGRVAFTERALPMVLPGTYTVRGDEVIASLVGVDIDRAIGGSVVAFEVDGYDPPTGEGWCVSVVGPARHVTDRALIAELDELGVAAHTPDAEPRRGYVAVQIAVLRGRRLSLASRAGAVLEADVAEAG